VRHLHPELSQQTHGHHNGQHATTSSKGYINKHLNKRAQKQSSESNILDDDGKLVPEEIEKRRTCSDVKTIKIGEDMSIRYAVCTQRGYYPDDHAKPNQDAFSITQHFAQTEDDVLFAVYDGHGPDGEVISNYAKKYIPDLISKYIIQQRAKLHKLRNQTLLQNECVPFIPKLFPKLPLEQYENACMTGHIQCNKNVIQNEKKSTFSGTTSISAAIHDGFITISNVGDSRAVLGYKPDPSTDIPQAASILTIASTETEDDTTSTSCNSSTSSTKQKMNKEQPIIRALPLSKDQTPWRQDERDRIRNAGGRILTIDQLEGKQDLHDDFGDKCMGEDGELNLKGDIPRVFLQNEKIPGTAFTRSIGDSKGESVGVFAVPEIVSKKISKDYRYLVLGSDGIFEFLPNQVVVNMCAECSDPRQACINIVQKSYEKWLTYEDRTDDITIIVIFFEFNDAESVL
jgi:serine/threonine protein phosphatase PrpC